MPSQNSFALSTGQVALSGSSVVSSWTGLTPGQSYTVTTYQWIQSLQSWAQAGSTTKVATSSTEAFSYGIGLSLSGSGQPNVFLQEALTSGGSTTWGASLTFYDGVPTPVITAPSSGSVVSAILLRVICYQSSSYQLTVTIGNQQQSFSPGSSLAVAEAGPFSIGYPVSYCVATPLTMTVSQAGKSASVSFTYLLHGSVSSATVIQPPSGAVLAPGTYQFSWSYSGTAASYDVSVSVQERRGGQWYHVASATGNSVTATISPSATEVASYFYDHGTLRASASYQVAATYQDGAATFGATAALNVTAGPGTITGQAGLLSSADLQGEPAIVNPASASVFDATVESDFACAIDVAGVADLGASAELVHSPPIVVGGADMIAFALLGATGRRYAVRRLPPAGVSRLPRV